MFQRYSQNLITLWRKMEDFSINSRKNSKVKEKTCPHPPSQVMLIKACFIAVFPPESPTQSRQNHGSMAKPRSVIIFLNS